jgi:hypothetical protein
MGTDDRVQDIWDGCRVSDIPQQERYTDRSSKTTAGLSGRKRLPEKTPIIKMKDICNFIP